MKAFNGSAKLKTLLIKEVHKHYLADQIISGTYGEGSNGDFKGCAVGCSIHSYNRLVKGKKFNTNDHKAFEDFGIPEWLARVQDTIFEGLPKTHNTKWPERFFSAIRPGADLNKIKGPFCIFILQSALENVDGKKFPYVVKSIQDVIYLHKSKETDESKWSAAESAAESARSAAWSAAESAAESARSAAWSAARSAAESAAYIKFANKLIKLMKSA